MRLLNSILLLVCGALLGLPSGSLSAQEVQPFPFSEPLEIRTGEADEIETDRDSFTPATTTAGDGRIIVESAYSWIDNRTRLETHSLPELLVRYGWNDWLELRVGTNYEVGGAPNSISSGGASEEFDPVTGGLERETTISYGFKAGLTQQNGWVPQSAAIVQASTPVSGEDTDTQLVATYVGGWRLANGWQFDSALRYVAASDRADRFGIWAPSVVLKVPVGEQWKAHVEYFGLFTEDKAEPFWQDYFSVGAHYLLNSDWEVGLRVGWGLTDDSAKFFSNVGLGWRF